MTKWTQSGLYLNDVPDQLYWAWKMWYAGGVIQYKYF